MILLAAAATELAVDGGGAALIAAAIWAVAHGLTTLRAEWKTEHAARQLADTLELANVAKHRERECVHWRRMERYAKVQAMLAQERYHAMTKTKEPLFEDTQPIPVPRSFRVLAERGEDG